MNQYVIIGNGVAAAGCIEGIRSTDRCGSIVVISQENRPVYCRPLISYCLQGKTDLTRMNYRADDFYETMRCRVLYGERRRASTAGQPPYCWTAAARSHIRTSALRPALARPPPCPRT